MGWYFFMTLFLLPHFITEKSKRKTESQKLRPNNNVGFFLANFHWAKLGKKFRQNVSEELFSQLRTNDKYHGCYIVNNSQFSCTYCTQFGLASGKPQAQSPIGHQEKGRARMVGAPAGASILVNGCLNSSEPYARATLVRCSKTGANGNVLCEKPSLGNLLRMVMFTYEKSSQFFCSDEELHNWTYFVKTIY